LALPLLLLAQGAFLAAPVSAQDIPSGATSNTSSAALLSQNLGVSESLPYGSIDDSSNWDLIDSGFDLASVDPASGALLGDDARSGLTDAYMVAAELDDLALADQQARAAAEDARRRMLAKRSSRLPAGTPYAEILEAAADAAGIDPALLAAVAETESNFDPEVINCSRASSAGARGLMQFMPETAATFNIDPCDPAQAATAAALYLKELYDEFGSWDLAIAAYNAGGGKVRAAGNQVPNIKETKNYVAKVNRLWLSNTASAAESAASQTEVGPEGCPTSAPPNTLRHGSDRVGIAEICRAAVADARTPQAAAAIKVALTTQLGKPYSQPKRNSPGFFDCSSFVTRAYSAVGVPLAKAGQNAPTTATMRHGYPWGRKIGSVGEAKAGDLILPTSGHVTMYLGGGWLVHTNATGDVSHVRNLYTQSPVLILAVDPAKA
jgi:soluble lytic murein transglycosylase-like protein